MIRIRHWNRRTHLPYPRTRRRQRHTARRRSWDGKARSLRWGGIRAVPAATGRRPATPRYQRRFVCRAGRQGVIRGRQPARCCGNKRSRPDHLPDQAHAVAQPAHGAARSPMPSPTWSVACIRVAACSRARSPLPGTDDRRRSLGFPWPALTVGSGPVAGRSGRWCAMAPSGCGGSAGATRRAPAETIVRGGPASSDGTAPWSAGGRQ